MKAKQLAVLFLTLVLIMGCQQSAWTEFKSPEGAFSVEMPGTPTEETLTVNTEVGPIEVHLFTLEQGEVAYMAGYSDYPEALVQQTTPDVILDGARDGAVSNVQGKLLSELIISLDGYPGRELKIEPAAAEATIKARIFMVGHRLYQVMMVTPEEESFSPDVQRFLDSFKLLEK